jgi:4-hydroxybenzoate polyprenyltransferase
MVLTERLHAYVQLTRLDRPIGIYLVLWPTLWALWIAAEGIPNLLVLGVFLAGVVLMRSAGCAINDFADRKIDPHVSRTAQRPLASGRIQPAEAVGVFVLLSLVAFALVLLMNRLTVLLSIPAVLLAVSYPFMKRYTHLPQAYLGVAFGWAVPMAFAAETGTVPPMAWLLFIATVFWALAYDTMYAIADREDDLKIGVKSTAILFGRYDRFAIGVMQFLVVVILVMAGLSFGLGAWYYAGLAVASGFSLYEQYLIRNRDPALSFRAFLNNNYFGLTVFAGILLHYLFQ